MVDAHTHSSYTHFKFSSTHLRWQGRARMSDSNISAELLDTPVSDQDLSKIAEKYLRKWEKLSPELELTPQQETEIKSTFRDYDDQKREALRKWREMKGNAATYRAFNTAAAAISNMELVENVKAMLQTREKSTGKKFIRRRVTYVLPLAFFLAIHL